MKEKGCHTLGQYLAWRIKNKLSVRLKTGEPPLYARRQLVEEEFNQIWSTQAKYHPVLSGTHQGRPIRDCVHQAIFYQRPLKSPKALAGKCACEPNLPRAPKAQPLAQAFRIEKQIADLSWGPKKRSVALTVEQKQAIREFLYDQDMVPFDALYNHLQEKGCPPPPGTKLNLEWEARDKLHGDRTMAVMRKLGLGEDWKSLDHDVQAQVINFLADLGSPEQVQMEDWDRRFTKQERDENGKPIPGKLVRRGFNSTMVAFINKMRKTGQFDRLSKMGFESGRSAYSLKALRKLTEVMRNEGVGEYEARQRLYKGEEPNGDRPFRLALLPKVGNVCVQAALRQLGREVNQMIDRLGEPPQQIIIEMARELAMGLKQRGEVISKQVKNTKAQERIRNELKKAQHQVTPTAIFRYQLWEDQEKKWCPYCTMPINLEDAMNGAKTQIEHILPRTLTRVARKRSELVLAHRECNDAKGNRTPYQAWGEESVGHDPERWKAIEVHAKQFVDNKCERKAKLLLTKSIDEDRFNDVGEFTDRQFAETAWIAKLAGKWLRSICSDVAVSRGSLTAYLRRVWKLDTVIPQLRYEAKLPVWGMDEKEISEQEFETFRTHWENHPKAPGIEHTEREINKRIDHRQHGIDAIVVGLSDRSLHMRMAEDWKRQADRAKRGEKITPRFQPASPIQDIRRVALEALRTLEVSHKHDRHGGGPLFNEQPSGIAIDKRKGQVLVQRKKLIELAKPGEKKGEVQKRLEGIASSRIREVVLKEFNQRMEAGKSAQEALKEPIYFEHPGSNGYRTPIRRVAILGSRVEISQHVFHQDRQGRVHQKRLLHDGVAYLEVCLRNGELIGEPRVVRPADALRHKHFTHGEDDGQTVRFYKDDMVRDKKDGRLYVIRQIKERNGGLLVLTLHSEALPVRKLHAPARRDVSSWKIARLARLDDV